MLKPNEIYNLIQDSVYTKSGLDVDWTIKIIDNTIYLLFHGSNSNMDWKINFDFPIRPYKHQENPMWVHRGFVKSYKSCNDEIMNSFIKEVFNNSDKEIVIAGHSYGGAMSMFAAEDFNYRTNKKAKVITFGAPDIMAPISPKTKKHFDNSIGERQIFAIRTDIVPRLPPFYSGLKKTKLGKFSIKGLFKKNPIPHCSYGDEKYYK